jgi:NADH-quinone oxidoreductase subunit C
VAVTEALSGANVAARIRSVFPAAVIAEDAGSVTVPAAQIVEVAGFLRDDPDLDCKYLTSLTAVDRLDHFDIVYHLSSLAKNHILCLKARAGHDEPVVPSVFAVWQGADLQEREVYDLMGVTFSGHPRMRRIFLWEGFPGHPLRKDFLTLPGGFKPGLQRFPFEFPEGETEYAHLGRAAGESAAGPPSEPEAPSSGEQAEAESPAP